MKFFSGAHFVHLVEHHFSAENFGMKIDYMTANSAKLTLTFKETVTPMNSASVNQVGEIHYQLHLPTLEKRILIHGPYIRTYQLFLGPGESMQEFTELLHDIAQHHRY
ncbi:hypothetical protein SFC11_06145 [Exiguobacterium indicum]|uniref:hypothetical protein n=1 Tax=Exiguobacterium indicum TaxID=296995 RepID=UPI003314FDB4